MQDNFLFARMMDYLANQMAVMIACAAMCPVDWKVEETQADDALAQLKLIRVKTKKHRDLAVSEMANTEAHGDTG